MGTGIGPRLSLRQAPGLALTPELRQAIRLLQMPSTELIQHVEQELELNPLLERADPPAAPLETASPPAATSSDEGEDGGGGFAERWIGSPAGEEESSRDVASRGVSLRDHLATQIATDIPEPRDRAIALALLEALDEAGYVSGDIADS
jgi:RNA polymerase sigma-54 factor